MSAPTCYVIGASEFEQLLGIIFQVVVMFAVLAWVCSVDWHLLEDRVRRFFRRRRLQRIRAARLGFKA